MSNRECEICGGEGYTSHDCGEDSCCCLDPEDNVLCEACGGTGYISERSRITGFICGRGCINGEHQWDGPAVRLEHGGSVSCSKCGKLAIDGRPVVDAMKKVFYYIRDSEGNIIAEVEGIEMKFADLPGKYALRSVNGCKSKWQVDETETGTLAGEGSTMMSAIKDFHFHVDQAGSDGVQTLIDTRKQKMGLK